MKQKRSYLTYAYGQIFKAYLESGKRTKFKVINPNAYKWDRILRWLKRNEYITDFKRNLEVKDAMEIEGFNNIKLMYIPYLKAIAREYTQKKITA